MDGVRTQLMPLIGLFQWFDGSTVGVWIRASTYAFAVLECFHLLGMVCLLGSMIAIDLRVLGFGLTRQPAAKVAAALTPVTLVGLGTMIVTGLLLFSSEALKCYDNAAFPWKMACFFSGLIIFVTLHRGITKLDDARIGVGSKAVAALSLVLWFGVAVAGRAIAFV
jgi:hypothetical protein